MVESENRKVPTIVMYTKLARSTENYKSNHVVKKFATCFPINP